jgi:formylglycine-generating enzyme required for sulfatase activity
VTRLSLLGTTFVRLSMVWLVASAPARSATPGAPLVPAQPASGGAAPSAGSGPALIPTGAFQQGGGRAADERPTREVTLSAYRIDRTEVTIAEYERFATSGGYADAKWWSEAGKAWLAEHPDGAGAALRSSGRSADHPVVAVTWYEADAYCRWRGGALPTEAQWERAACAAGAKYPWGNEENFDAVWFGAGKFGQIESVATRPAHDQSDALRSPAGLLHAAGNVWEWTQDAYDARYYASAPAVDPVNTADRPWRTLRGGSFMNLPSYCTCTHREPALPDEARLTAGFRCAYPG